MEIKEDDMDQEANTEQDFHFKVPTAEDEDDMDDLSSDEGEVEEFIKDYHIEEEDDVRLLCWSSFLESSEHVFCTRQ